MALIKCKMCGGDLILDRESPIATCEFCGTVQTVPGLDDEKKLVLFERANRLRYTCEFDKAASVYEAIVADFRNEAEAYWGLVLCKYGIEYVTDPASGRKVPTCHRSSFESVMKDNNFEQALENADVVARRVYREEAKQIEELRKGILEISSREEPYDVFICYKETDFDGKRTLDSVLAQDIYGALTDKGYRVFFSRISLEDKLGLEYEPYIFAALNSAKIMLVIGTDYEYFNAVWVKNEWSRFLKLMAQDKQKHLIPCFKGIDAYDMPEEFARLQAQDLDKMGAIQDILRGMEKLIVKKQETVKETVVVQSDSGAATMVERGNLALEDGDWQNADRFFEEALNRDPKNADAYWGKVLCQARCSNGEAFVRHRQSQTEAVEPTTAVARIQGDPEALVEKYTIPGYFERKDILIPYQQFAPQFSRTAPGREKQKQQESSFWSTGLLGRAVQFAQPGAAVLVARAQLLEAMDQRIRTATKADEEAEHQVNVRYEALEDKVKALHGQKAGNRDQDYEYCRKVVEQKDSSTSALRSAVKKLGAMAGYRNSAKLIYRAQERLMVLAAEAEERALLEAKQQKKRIVVTGVIVTSVIALMMFLTLLLAVVIPAIQEAISYNDAQSLMDAGHYMTQREMVSAGDEHAVAVKANGNVVSAGETAMGQCDVSRWDDVVAVSAGAEYTLGLKPDGTVVAAGDNEHGQCDVSGWTKIVAISAGNNHSLGLRADGTVLAVGNDADRACDVSDWTGIVSISAGGYHSAGLRQDGTVVIAGNYKDVSGWRNIIAISAGEFHTVGLREDGTVVATGRNGFGQCDVSHWRDIVAISAGVNYTVGLKADGTVVTAGSNDRGRCDVSGWPDIVAISAGQNRTLGLKADGTVVMAGEALTGSKNVTDWGKIKLPE